jgi:hypothetical protein
MYFLRLFVNRFFEFYVTEGYYNMSIPFSNRDEQYRQWLLQNPFGFVLNGNNPETQNYQVLYRADCHCIQRPVTAGQQLTVSYLKRCSTSRTDLEAATITYCTFCQRAGRL